MTEWSHGPRSSALQFGQVLALLLVDGAAGVKENLFSLGLDTLLCFFATLSQVADDFLGVFGAEDGRAGHDDIGTSVGASIDRLGSNTSIDLNVKVRKSRSQFGDLLAAI